MTTVILQKCAETGSTPKVFTAPLLSVKCSECGKKRQPEIIDPIFIILHFVISLSLITFLGIGVLDTN